MNDRVRRRRAAQRRARLVRSALVALVAVVVVGVVVVIAVSSRGSEADGPVLSDAARQGQQLAVQRSCVGCHGRDGEGGVGPAWVGLYGSTVTLDDGSTVVADRAYLLESIRDPRAKQVAGYGKMPVDSIGDADIAAIVAYIEELASPSASTPP